VNVGDRQRGRERDPNVLEAEADAAAITAAIERARSSEVPRFEPRLGNGRAGERIVEVLKATELDTRLLQKALAY
jgi:GDP/UDP-N,N'-diacetylbacillosamine 2-epimerase (hydrolysing)